MTRSLRPFLVAITALAVASTGIGSATAAPATDPSAPDAVIARYSRQSLTWRECYPGSVATELLCASFRTPRDWANPSRGDITVTMSRVVATDQARRRGVLFLNPGGPGDSGILLPYYTESRTAVAAVYDLVSFDPRGVGRSTVLSCASPAIIDRNFDLDGRDLSPANTAEFVKTSTQWGRQCSSDPLTPYITTEQTVRDMDLMRALLGERKISYLGYSAGTWLGTHYAVTFPNRTDRFVLDGNFAWTGTWDDGFAAQAAAFQNSYERYLIPWLATNDATYHLGATPTRVRATIEARRAALVARPIALGQGLRIDGPSYDYGISSALYWTGYYSAIGAALATLEHWTTATPQEQDDASSWFTTASDDHGSDPFFAIICGDTANPPASVAIERWLAERTRNSLTGAIFFDPCIAWSNPPAMGTLDGRALPPMLMLQNDADPATPYSGGLAAHRAAPNTRLITVRDQPDHTIYGAGISCVDDAVDRWLLDGVLPRRDLTCQGQPLPDPTVATATARGAGTTSPAATSPYHQQVAHPQLG